MGQYSSCFTFRHQAGAKGYFAEVQVEIEIEVIEGERSLKVCFEDQKNFQWREAAIVGVRSAWRHVPAKLTAKACATVRILHVAWQPVDTTDMTVVFAAAHAVFAALEVEPRERPEFIVSYGAFLFPK